MNDRRIYVDYIARTEGDGRIDVIIGPDGELKKARWEVWEPPRFFEAFMVGRKYDEVPEISERICGICPHPHNLASVQAVERAMGIKVTPQTVLLRKVLGFGDWIQSHSLHVFCLAIPDFLGYESVIAMSENAELLPVVQGGLALKRLGNDISVVIGGREIHPVTSIVGGFTAVPTISQLRELKEKLQANKEFAIEAVKLCGKLASQEPYSELTRKCEHVSLHEEEEYPVNDGRLVSTDGLDVPNCEYKQWLIERHVPGCTCKHAIVKGRDSFLAGPLARVNNNFEQLSPDAKQAAREAGFTAPCFNPFMSIVARMLEIVQSIDSCQEIIEELGEPKYEEPRYEIKGGEGYAVAEAPRGIVCHGGRINNDGVVEKWDVVAPTSRNVYNLENDFQDFIPKLLHLSDEELTLKCEIMVRNYDPCQSCSTHSLNVKLKRER